MASETKKFENHWSRLMTWDKWGLGYCSGYQCEKRLRPRSRQDCILQQMPTQCILQNQMLLRCLDIMALKPATREMNLTEMLSLKPEMTKTLQLTRLIFLSLGRMGTWNTLLFNHWETNKKKLTLFADLTLWLWNSLATGTTSSPSGEAKLLPGRDDVRGFQLAGNLGLHTSAQSPFPNLQNSTCSHIWCYKKAC